jgi:hypothetical protein
MSLSSKLQTKNYWFQHTRVDGIHTNFQLNETKANQERKKKINVNCEKTSGLHDSFPRWFLHVSFLIENRTATTGWCCAMAAPVCPPSPTAAPVVGLALSQDKESQGRRGKGLE